MQKLGFFLISILLINGCASKKSLRTSSTGETICFHKSTDDTYAFLLKNMKKRYLGSTLKNQNTIIGTYDGTILSGMSSTTFIENKKLDKDKYEIILSIKVGITHRMFGEIINITKGKAGCNTNINLRYMNKAWKNIHGKFIKNLLKIY